MGLAPGLLEISQDKIMISNKNKLVILEDRISSNLNLLDHYIYKKQEALEHEDQKAANSYQIDIDKCTAINIALEQEKLALTNQD